MALGAQRDDVLRLILMNGGKLVGIGLALGLVGAFATTHLLRSLLFGIGAYDPLTFVVIAALLSAVAAFACWFPARRATKVDPMVALRSE
jgi:ABC-type antimicrobial peptide transport system permease subunit